MSKHAFRIHHALGAFIALALLPLDSAHALSFAFAPDPTDASIGMVLSKLFGGALPTGSSWPQGLDPLSGMLKYINAFALAIGGAMAAYTMVAGILQTAQDGVMMGKKWNSMWLPLRTVFGLSMAIPLGNGYCLAQYLVMWLCFQGAGLASSAWGNFVNAGYAQITPPKVSAPAIPAARFAYEALQIQVCMATIQNAPRPASAPTPTVAASRFANASGTGNHFGYAAGGLSGLAAKSACGTLAFPPTTNLAASDTPANLGPAPSTGAEQAIASAHQAQSAALIGKMGALAVSVVNPQYSTPNPAAFDEAVKAYQDAIASAADSAKAVDPSIVNAKATAGGWLMAGSWLRLASDGQNALSKAANAVPTLRAYPDPAALALVGVNQDLLAMNLKNAHLLYEATANGATHPAPNPFSTHIPGALSAQEDGLKISKWAASWLSHVDWNRAAQDQRHPLASAVDLGNQLHQSLGLATSALAATPASSGSLGGIIGPLLAGLMLASFAAAALLANILPMIPLAIFIAAAFGWMLLAAQAMIAAPLWAIMHLTPGGDDATGSAKKGYALLLSLAVRPIMIVFGFCAAIVISHPLGSIASAIFFQGFDPTTASIGDAASRSAGLFAYALLLCYAIHRCFCFCYAIPDSIIDWISHSGSSSASASGDASASSTSISSGSGAAAAAAAAQTAASTQTSSGTSSSGQRGSATSASARAAIESRMDQTGNHIQMQEKGAAGKDASPMYAGTAEINVHSAIVKTASSSNNPQDITVAIGLLKDSAINRRDAGQQLAKAGEQSKADESMAAAATDLDAIRSLISRLSRLAGLAEEQARQAMAKPPANRSAAFAQAEKAKAAAKAIQSEAGALLELAQLIEPNPADPDVEAERADLSLRSIARSNKADGFFAQAKELEALRKFNKPED